jgi:hypothetical protein
MTKRRSRSDYISTMREMPDPDTYSHGSNENPNYACNTLLKKIYTSSRGVVKNRR